jgi:hypothetical protein
MANLVIYYWSNFLCGCLAFAFLPYSTSLQQPTTDFACYVLYAACEYSYQYGTFNRNAAPTTQCGKTPWLYNVLLCVATCH